MKKRFLAVLLTLVMALALAVPAFAATIEAVRYQTDGDEEGNWYYMRDEDGNFIKVTSSITLDRDVIAVVEEWWGTSWSPDGFMPVYQVPVGTTVAADSESDLQRILDGILYADGSRWATEEELGKMGYVPSDDWGGWIVAPFQIKSEDYYQIGVEAIATRALLKGVAQDGTYDLTVDRKTETTGPLNICGILSQRTATYQGETIPLYTVVSSSEEAPCLVKYYHPGDENTLKVSSAVNSGGTLTDVEEMDEWSYTGEGEGWNRYKWYIPNDGTEPFVRLLEISENGVKKTIAVSVMPDGTAPAEPEKPAETEKPAGPAGTHTVKYGDTWGQLALNNYGSYGAWHQLYEANGKKDLGVGVTVTLPEKLGTFTRLPAQVLAEGEELYTVKAGDTLGQIAFNQYKDFSMYKTIFERNSDRLKDANSIYEGQVLILPVKK